MNANAGILSVLALLVTPYVYADDKPLATLVEELKRHEGSTSSPFSVVAVASLVEGQDLCLSFTLTNISQEVVSLFPEALPWGNTYSITWVALTANGHALPLNYPIDDPGPAKLLTVAPGQVLKGTYRLSQMLDRRAIPIGTDLVIVWVYRFPAGPSEGQDPRPPNSGIAFVHTPK